MYDQVLIPTDGSEGSLGAIEHGVALARELGARVHGLSVVESPGAAQRDQLRTDVEEEAQRAADVIAQEADRAGVDVVTVTRDGMPGETIVEYAELNDVDLIVMGTHGRSGVQHVLMGSIAEEVIRNAPVPVATVRYDEEA